MNKVVIGQTKLQIADFKRAVFEEDIIIELFEPQLREVAANHAFLKQYAGNKVIYGVNTGFGPMAQYIIADEDQKDLQYNLIRSHASGMGDRLSPLQCRATAIARLNSLMTAKSGIHPECVELLAAMINRSVLPIMYAHGGVGASGDLVQLAHLALGMIGEGEVYYKGQVQSAAEAMADAQLQPMQVHIREGLALMNGTSCMTGIGLLNLIGAETLFNWSLRVSSMINEIVESYDDHLHPNLNEAKWHVGQQYVASEMRSILADSQRLKNRAKELYNGSPSDAVLKEKVQEYYSIRCVPQILGPVYDTIHSATETVTNELNSSNDNPLIFHQEREILHGGNFHGDYVSLEMDKVKLVSTKLSMLCERQLNYLLNDRLNGKLTPFVNSGKLGFNFGLQGTQFPATSTTAENQMLSNSMYVHSIPCNNDNQDIVSMGTNSALMTAKVIENAFDVLTIEMLAVVRAIALLDIPSKLAGQTRTIYEEIRSIVEISASDKSYSAELARLREYLKDN